MIDPQVDVGGTYTYTVSGVSPCPNAVAVVLVNIAPVPDAGVNSASVHCTSEAPMTLLSLLQGSPQPTGSWRGPDGLPVQPTFDPADDPPGVYTYTVTGVAPCGIDEAELTISLSEAADAGSNAALTLCENSDLPAVLFTSLGGAPDAGGGWTSPSGATFDGTFVPGEDLPGTYTYTVEAASPCIAVASTILVSVVPIPEATIAVEGGEACVPAEVTLTNTYSGPGTIEWTLWNGEQVTTPGPIIRTITDGGTFDVRLVIDAGNGCGTDTVNGDDLIVLFDRPVADFVHLPEQVNILDPEVQFNNMSTGATSFQWSVQEAPFASTVNATYVFPSEISASYTVCLVASASASCADTACEVIAIEDGLSVHVPNAFTPDESGINDVFRPIVLGVEPEQYAFMIFDRWGQILFETNDPATGWNGRFSDGGEVPIGVYVWKLIAKDRITTNRIERIGHVTLVR